MPTTLGHLARLNRLLADQQTTRRKNATEAFMDDQQQSAMDAKPGQPAKPLRGLLIGSLLLAGLLIVFSPNYRWKLDKGDSPYGSDFLQRLDGSQYDRGRAGWLDLPRVGLR
ncbi:MAG: hypothetical protein R3C56_38310 [Pirellulaceae bacterium]